MIEPKKFLRRSAGDDAAGFQQNYARGKEQGFAQIVRDENDRLAKAVGQCAEFPLKLRTRDGVKRTERLVHQQYGRVGSEGTSDANALALAPRKFAREAMRKFAGVEADELEHFLDAGGDVGRIPALQIGNEADVLGNREMGEETGLLNDVTDTPAEAGEIPIAGRAGVDEDFAFRGK
jgi:hypothetical protein